MTEPGNLATALAAFQAELPTISKRNTADTGSYSYKYADLADVSTLVLPLLGKHGLSFSAMPTLDDAGKFVLEYALRHRGGDVQVGRYPLPSGTPQQIGSAITYARRYALCSVTGVAPEAEDDDGKGAADTRVEANPTRWEQDWDPIEQDVLVVGYIAEVEDAKDEDAIKDIGRRVLAKKRSRELSPASVDRITQAAAARKAELNGAPA